MSYLEIRDVAKGFGAVKALTAATLSLERGQVMGLCGANGAGKSTLIKILAGANGPDSGEISVGGETVRTFNPQHAMSLGIGVVYQELALVPELPVYKNVFLGMEPRRGLLPDTARMKARSREILAEMGVDIDVDTRLGSLSLHLQQIVEIAKAMCRGSSVLILDEPTAILNESEKRHLFGIIAELKKRGLCIIFITHFINELFETCDFITVMRDGRTVKTSPVGETSREAVIFDMVGAMARHENQAKPRAADAPALIEIRDGGITGRFHGVDLDIGAGEIVGLAGIVGSGCYEVAETLFGIRRLGTGEMRLDGEVVQFADPRDAVRHGIGYVPEDRRGKGLCLNLPSRTNTALAMLPDARLSRLGVLNADAIKRAFLGVAGDLELHPPNPALLAANFSGGNQQKLVVGKWIERGCRVYVFVEPTRGVDIRAKAQIWKIIGELAASGAAVMIVSTDFDDIAAVSGRCLVMVEGAIASELRGADINVENISAIAAAVRGHSAPVALVSRIQ